MSDPFEDVQSPDMAVRRAAEQMLAGMLIDRKITVADVIDHIRTGDMTSRWYLSRALSKAGPGMIPEMLAIAEKETDIAVLKYLVAVFAEFGEPAVAPLIQLLSSPNAALRGLICTALERIGQPALDPLLEASKSADPMTKMCALYILQRNGICLT